MFDIKRFCAYLRNVRWRKQSCKGNTDSSECKTSSKEKEVPSFPGGILTDSPLVYTMSTDDIQQHLDSLNNNLCLSGRQTVQKCIPMVNRLINDPNGWVFRDPVDSTDLGIPDYFNVVNSVQWIWA